MKIALPTRNEKIDDHFGHCEYYTIVTIDNRQITEKELLKAPAGCGCKSNIAQTLSDMGISVMLAGNMGDGAVNVLKNSGIDVLRGCSGNIDDVVTAWLAGELQDSGVICQEHEHECHH